MTTDTDHDALFREMDEAFDADEFAYSLELSRKIVVDDPGFIVGWMYQGLTLFKLGRFSDAEVAFRYVIEHTDSDQLLKHCYECLGNSFTETGEFGKAETNYRTAIELDPDDASGHIYLGVMFARTGDIRAAEASYRCAVQCATGCIDEALLNLALILRSQERYCEALPYVGEVLRIDARDETAAALKRDLVKVIERGKRG